MVSPRFYGSTNLVPIIPLVISVDCGSLVRPLTRAVCIHFPDATVATPLSVDRLQYKMDSVSNITATCLQRSQMINCDLMEGYTVRRFVSNYSSFNSSQ